MTLCERSQGLNCNSHSSAYLSCTCIVFRVTCRWKQELLLRKRVHSPTLLDNPVFPSPSRGVPPEYLGLRAPSRNTTICRVPASTCTNMYVHLYLIIDHDPCNPASVSRTRILYWLPAASAHSLRQQTRPLKASSIALVWSQEERERRQPQVQAGRRPHRAASPPLHAVSRCRRRFASLLTPP